MYVSTDTKAGRIIFDAPPREANAWLIGIFGAALVVAGFGLLQITTSPGIGLLVLAAALVGGPYFALQILKELTALTATLDGKSRTLTVDSTPRWGTPHARSIAFSDIAGIAALAIDNGEAVDYFVEIQITGQPRVRLPYTKSDSDAVEQAVYAARHLVGLPPN